jgi:hypothetical protein
VPILRLSRDVVEATTCAPTPLARKIGTAPQLPRRTYPSRLLAHPDVVNADLLAFARP